MAGLKVILANFESITPEGKATTNTVLYWVWNDGTNLYTYDPDGDAITERSLIGLHESMEGYITGNVTLGNEVVGFATQFTAAGEYIFDYYVKDSNGNQSNIVRYRNEIEPADGNKRPVCSLKVKNGLNVIGIPVTFSLADSYDNDGSDSISGFTLQVDSGRGYQTLMQNDMQAFTNGISITFRNTDTYGIAASVIDNHNNRSDWITGSITISGGSVTLNSGEEWKDSIPTQERIAEFYGGMAKRLDDAYSEGKFTKDEYDELNGMIEDGMEWETRCAESLKAFHAVSAKMFNHSDSEAEKSSLKMSLMTPEERRAEMRSQIADYVRKYCRYDRSAILNMFNSVRYGE